MKIILILMLILCSSFAMAQTKFTSENKLVSLTYPEDWTDVSNETEEIISNGSIDIKINPVPYEGDDKIDPTVVQDDDFKKMMTLALADALQEYLFLLESDEVKVGGINSYYFIWTRFDEPPGDDDPEISRLYMIQTQSSKGIVTFYIFGPPEEITSENETLAKIISSVKFH
ncbi:MAG TPA: hypothetical protein VK004_03275 [Ignavibacteria bacterium]|nr:hypothetical protein [Ignavibacteria bacterium]